MRIKASLRRFRDILLIATRHAVLHAAHMELARWPRIARRLPGENLSAPKRFRCAIEEIGGTFIKFGQMMAMQTDMIPLDYCTALFCLFDRVPPFDYADVERTFLEDLQRTPLEVFESFEKQPIATGSIGQVHVATLNGQKVAVKVRRPTILNDFHADIATLEFTVRAVKLLRIRPLYWIIPPTEEFIAWTREELDYRREGRYMEELGRNAKDNDHEKVPAVFWSYTTSRILTAEFLDGITVSEYLRQMNGGRAHTSADVEPDIFAARLIDNFLGDAFRYGMFHADLHPGNLMILPGNVVGYIDFGISGVLSRYSRRHVIAMTLAYARGDLEALCEAFFPITTFNEDADIPGFLRGLKEISAGWYGNRTGESRLCRSITAVMLDLLCLSRQNGICPQRDVIKYIRSAIALDGLVKTFSPNVDVGLHLEQACERHIKWDSLRNLVSPETMVGWFGGVVNLIRDGTLRGLAALHHVGTDRSLARSFLVEEQQTKNTRSPSIKVLSAIWISLCAAMIWWSPGQILFGHDIGIAVPALAGLGIIAWRVLKAERTTGST
jgi:ubiquinone biosynthesis protein